MQCGLRDKEVVKTQHLKHQCKPLVFEAHMDNAHMIVRDMAHHEFECTGLTTF